MKVHFSGGKALENFNSVYKVAEQVVELEKCSRRFCTIFFNQKFSLMKASAELSTEQTEN